MNHLAHLFLASPGSDSLLGNLSGDFVKGTLDGRFSSGIAGGILQHRRIDAFTDAHPAVAEFRRVIDAGHYGRIIADMFLDHFLAFTWSEWSSEPLPDFLRRVFGELDGREGEMPERLRRVYPAMRDHRWLESYATFDGIWTALYFLSRRVSREPRLEMWTYLLIHEREKLEAQFRSFMPDVIRFARDQAIFGSSASSCR